MPLTPDRLIQVTRDCLAASLVAFVLISIQGCKSGGNTDTSGDLTANGGSSDSSTSAPATPSTEASGETPDGSDVENGENDNDGPVNTTEFSDEFDINTLSDWSLRHEVENSPAQYTVLEINRSAPGALTIVPTLTPGWFADGDAPLVFKLVSGNFSIETDVLAESSASPGLPPGQNFNSGGLMARNPQQPGGAENHVMVNLGRQNESLPGFIGSESKSTRDSNSRLTLQAGSNHGRLILCRVGEIFYTYRQMDNETSWTRIGEISRPDLPDTLQAGMVANGFTGPDLRATFDYIRLHIPVTESQCIAG